MRLLVYGPKGERAGPRIGALLPELGVVDLKLALARFFEEAYDMSPGGALELAGAVVTTDVPKLIERWRAIKSLLESALKLAERDPEPLKQAGAIHDPAAIRYWPVVPNAPKVIGIGLNYEEYRTMLGYEKPELPLFFLKPPSTLVGHEEPVIIPRGRRWRGTSSNCVYHEFEMAVIIGRRCKDIDRNRAYDCVFGVTVFSDITAHDIEDVKPGHVLYQQRAKAFDTFSPIGPWIVTMDEIREKGVDLHNLRIVRRRNGKLEGESNTGRMTYKIPELVEFLAEIMTLQPGDVISTGSPPAGPPEGLQPGDVIEAEVEFIGLLRNRVKLPD